MPAMSGASMSAPPQEKMGNLFSQIDAAGAGAINQAQFAQAFQTMSPPAVFQQAGADTVWNRLDPTGSGQVSQSDFVSTMKGLMVELRQGSSSSSSATAGAQTASSATDSLNLLGGRSTPGVDVKV